MNVTGVQTCALPISSRGSKKIKLAPLIRTDSCRTSGPFSQTDNSPRSSGYRISFPVAIRSHTLDGLVGLHGPCEFIERHGFSALVVSLRVDFGGLDVRYAADLWRQGSSRRAAA